MSHPYKSLVPGYKGDSVGHVVKREVRADGRRVMIPKRDAGGDVLAWMPIKVSTKVYVTFRWDGEEWKVVKVGS